MKQLKQLIVMAFATGIFITSCTKDSSEVAQQTVSQEVLQQIADMGFSNENVQIVEEGYLVEGDIILTYEQLGVLAVTNSLRIAETEQYHTTNLVTGLPRTITVSYSYSGNNAPNSNTTSAIQNACTRFNAENLSLTFNYIGNGGGGDINVKIVNGGGYIASAGFPSGGNPYPEVKFNKNYSNWGNNTLTTVFAHEFGHCIGFRHTDYMNRAFSCGTGGNEGDGGVGAIHIPGTPTGPDAASWMLACINNGINRAFNNNDKTALDYLY